MSKKRTLSKFKSKIGVNASWYPKYVWEIKDDTWMKVMERAQETGQIRDRDDLLL